MTHRCHVCNDEGKPDGCPKCGRTPRSAVGMKLMNFTTPTEIIPTPYQGRLWEKPMLEGLPLSFQDFDEKLEKVHNQFLKGLIPKFSMFIAAPPKSGKNSFAYSCMQTSLAQKFSVAPLLSTADWRRLYKVSQMNPFYKLFGKYQWDTLVVMDVVFLFIDHADDHNDDIPLIKSIMDTRASFGLSTFVISDYKLTDLVPKWNTDTYTMIHNSSDSRDYLRYPVILHRF